MSKISLFMSVFILSFFSIGYTQPVDVSIGTKTYSNYSDKIFVDPSGRELFFRGWNVGTNAKYPPHRPYKNTIVAAHEFGKLKALTGANIVRILLLWDGIHPQVDSINYALLDTIALQIKQAISLNMYVLLDWHQDLFTRHVNDGADGAPQWLVDSMYLPEGRCGKPCFAWSQNYFTNNAVKTALDHFWNNIEINTLHGKRKVQDEFIWQMRETIGYLKTKLSPQQWSYIIGIDPYNEPAEGKGIGSGRRKKWNQNVDAWIHEKYWPFVKKIRSMIDDMGLDKELLFAEPCTFWNVDVPFVRARGGGRLRDIPKSKNYVFNTHLYDEKRESTGIREARSGALFPEVQAIRKEARYRKMPAIISEFGGPVLSQRIKNYNCNHKAYFQAMEAYASGLKKDRFIDFYTLPISSIQWYWGEIPHSKDIRKKTNFFHPNVDSLVLSRIYPRKVGGRIMHFYYNDMATDFRKNKQLNWASMRFSDETETYLDGHKFFFMVWKDIGRKDSTEIYIPFHFDLSRTAVITNQLVIDNLDNLSTDEGIGLFSDLDIDIPSGHRLVVHSNTFGEGYKYILIVELMDAPNMYNLSLLQNKISQWVKMEKSPVYLTGKIRKDRYRRPGVLF